MIDDRRRGTASRGYTRLWRYRANGLRKLGCVAMQITVDVSGEFAAELARVAPSELSEILTLGIGEWRSRRGPGFAGLNGLLERLAELPEPRAVLSLRPPAGL